MSNVVKLQCTCGAVKGSLQVVPGNFFHVHCLCCDCQKFAKHLNNNSILDEHGGSELLQTYPEYLHITEGVENIECAQLRAKGLHRWYASCCNMPLANTMGSSKIPFVGVRVNLMKFASEQEKLAVLGPVTIKAFGQYAIGEMPEDVHRRFPLSYIPKILWFMVKGFFGKKYKPSPFFNDKQPIVNADVLS